MSGSICGNCGCPYLKSIDKKELGKAPYQCEICGWEGDLSNGIRAWLTDKASKDCSKRYKLKKEGRLFFVRVFIGKKSEDSKLDPTFKVIRALGLSGCQILGSGENRCLFFEQETAPSKALATEILAIPGVLSIDVF